MIKEFFLGVATLGRGFGLMGRRPRIFLLGAVPPLITSVLFVAVLVALITNLTAITAALTGFASGWGSGARGTVEVLAGIALVGGSVLIMVLTFSTLTLALGGPLYDKISELVDRELGDLPEVPEEPVLRGVGRAVRQAVALIAVSLLGSAVFFGLGFLPVVGQTVVPVLSAVFGGWLLTIELLGSPFERRGRYPIRDRRTAMGRRRARTLGFAVPSFLLAAVPFVAVVAFPAATAGANLLAREILAERTTGGGNSR
ncbi:CysZ protein [Friedmanniella endophytica]|uniref:CysZ protein n=1 Tax=Microlunatus kandeliicorticis TaxID=1759536 RepID=A0A7W3IQF4_9ACTN|nr:EI24 domain-containing protein [Microlunatus kandeliicorticis]MBA8793356.1 CysZ protein [Microlunatus kandeliicorticis]